ncbi:MAG: hypothetical protein ACYCX9_12340 [Candidatus Dormibacteria bacterium]|jgi:hypothetical protein|nr:hypothetical protein [Candidatus Dormibacteraeota bacterium]
MLLAAQIIWIVTLAIIVFVMTPLVVFQCRRLVRAAHDIERHFSVILTAAAGVVSATAATTELGGTITTAGEMLATAGSIEQTSTAIEDLLTSRLQGAGG